MTYFEMFSFTGLHTHLGNLVSFSFLLNNVLVWGFFFYCTVVTSHLPLAFVLHCFHFFFDFLEQNKLLYSENC